MSVQLEGFRELDDALGVLPEALRRTTVIKALRNAAEPMVESARAMAHRGRDPRKRGSKKQRDSGESERIGHGADSIAARAMPATENNLVEVAVAPDAQHWYMKFVEFGTARQSPSRFLTPAFETYKESVVERVGVELWKSMTSTANRLASQAESGTLTRTTREALSG